MCLETREGRATLHKHHKYTQHVSSYTHIPCFLASFSTRCLVEVCLVRFQPRWHQTQHIRWINSRRNQLLKGRWATRIFNDPAVLLPKWQNKIQYNYIMQTNCNYSKLSQPNGNKSSSLPPPTKQKKNTHITNLPGVTSSPYLFPSSSPTQ